MKTSTTSLLMLSGLLTITTTASAALPTRDALRQGLRPVAELPVRRVQVDAGALARFVTVDIERLPDTRAAAGMMTVAFVVEPRVSIGYPYLAQLAIDGSIVGERRIDGPAAVVLAATVKTDGVPHEACVRVVRLGTALKSPLVAERCFDVTTAPTR